MKRASRVGALALVWVAGCGSGGGPAEPTATAASPIQNGSVDSTDTFAVGIVQTSQLAQNQVAFCSGALLAPNLVATARHCVSQLSSTEISCATAVFGSTLPASEVVVTTSTQVTYQSPFVQVSQIIVPSGSNQTKVCGNDIALLVLQKNIALSQYVLPAINPPMTDHSTYSTSVTAIGYGIDAPTDMTGTTAGVRRIKQDVPLLCIPNDTQFSNCFSDPQAQQVLTAGEFVSGDASTCEGDSGSSAYDQQSFSRGQWVSFGVLSRGGVSPDGQTCIQPIYTRFDAWPQLLMDAAMQAASAGGYAAPDWASGSPLQLDGGLPGSASNAVGSGDSGTSITKSNSLGLGSTCSDDNQCQSNNCIATDPNATTGVCASPCIGGSCPTGFSCVSDYCLPTSAPSDAPPAKSGGCAVTTVNETGNARTASFACACACAVVLRRRRRGRALPSSSGETQ